MKKLLSLLGALLSSFLIFSISAEASTVRVKGYYKPSTGKYINSYYKTSPNKTRLDNYSTKGNYNPYTGKAGTKSYYRY